MYNNMYSYVFQTFQCIKCPWYFHFAIIFLCVFFYFLLSMGVICIKNLKMMKLCSKCCADDRALPSNNTNPDAYVETPVESNSKADHLDDQISINILPTEILLKILGSLDKVSLFYCYFVCKRWRNIVFYIADKDKTKIIWHYLCTQYQSEGFYQQNSNTNCSLPFQELIESSLKWTYNRCSIDLSISAPVVDAVQMNVYRDSIIVVTSAGVIYFDKETFNMKKTISLDNCHHFIENDYMVARSIKCENGEGYKLKLFGKRCFDDCRWESQITTCDIFRTSTTKELEVRVFKIEENRCFAVLKCNNTLNSYDWEYMETPMAWHKRYRCRYYGGCEIISMDLGRKNVYLLTTSGALFCYELERDGVIVKIYTYTSSQFMQSGFAHLVHRCNLIISVPDDSPPYVMRLRGSFLPVPTLYRLEVPKLTCVTEHGIVLFLGYSDGKVKIIKPMDFSRKNILKHFIDLSVYEKERPTAVVSIVVYVENGKQSVFVATTSCIYRFTPTFPDGHNIWDMENIVDLIYVPSTDRVSL